MSLLKSSVEIRRTRPSTLSVDDNQQIPTKLKLNIWEFVGKFMQVKGLEFFMFFGFFSEIKYGTTLETIYKFYTIKCFHAGIEFLFLTSPAIVCEM
jgi:hypothetical protein